MKKNHSEIETFFDLLEINRHELLEFLPIGILIFNENWIIKSINSHFSSYFEDQFRETAQEGINLFSRSYLFKTLPMPEIISLSKGENFRKEINPIINGEKTLCILKGSPIVKNGKFKGGILITEDYNESFDQIVPKFPSDSSAISILNLLDSTFFILNSEGIIQSVSEKIPENCEIFKESVGTKAAELFDPKSKNDIYGALAKAAEGKERVFLELSYFSDRKKIDFNSLFLPLDADKVNQNKIILMLREKVGYNKDTLGLLTESEEKMELGIFAEAGYDALFKINLHGNITFWAENSSKLFGLAKNEILKEFIGKIFTEVTHEYFENIRSKLLNEGKWEGYLASSRLRINEICQVKIVSLIRHNVTDLFVYCIKADRPNRNLIIAKQEEELFFKDTVVKSNQMVLQVDPTGTILFANDKFCENMDYELDEIRGEQFFNLIQDEFKSTHRLYDLESLIAKKDLTVLRLRKKSKDLLEVYYNANLSRENEEIKYFTFYFNESTIQDRLFMGTAESLMYNFPNPVLIVYENKIIKVNSEFSQFLGSASETEFYDKLIHEIIDPSSLENLNYLLHNYSIENDKVEISFVNNDKSLIKAKVDKICCSKESAFSVFILYPVSGSQQDKPDKVTEIKKSFEEIGPYYWSGSFKENEFVLNYVDPEFVRFLGYSEKEGFEDEFFMDKIIHPDDAEMFTQLIARLNNEDAKQLQELNYRVINKKGETVWIRNSVRIKGLGEDRIFHGSIMDVSDWFSEREGLKSTIDELNRLNSAKEKFISIISHDLKSPFTSIVGFADLILSDSSYGKEDILEFVGHIKEASLHTVDLLNSLLDLTKLQTGRIELEPKILNADHLVNKTVEILSGLAIKKNISLSSEIDKNLYINADGSLILQVFNNLVANSIKFTPNGGKIEITAVELGDIQKVEFRVKDSGVGIDPEDLDKLFVVDKKFTTLGTDGEKGTGLGLSLVREIIEKHKGEIKVESKPGEGSEFIFTLPISAPSILITDTADTERILYSRLLESITESIPILRAGSADEALRITKSEMPMLIITEHNLLNTTADEFIGKLLNSDIHYNPSFMIITKEYSEELHQSYKDMGVNHVFSKPFDLKQFKAALDKLTGKS